MARRRSPSVMMPTSRAVRDRPRPGSRSASRSSRTSARVHRACPGSASGIASPVCIRSRTRRSRAPSRPPGWNWRKSAAVKPRRVSSATASASPSAICMVVTGGRRQAHRAGLGRRRQQQRDVGRLRQRRLRAAPVIATSGSAEAPRMGDQVGQFRGLAGVRQRQHRVARRRSCRGRRARPRPDGRTAPACRWRRGSRRSCGRHGRTCPCRRRRRARSPPPAARRRARSCRPGCGQRRRPAASARSTSRATAGRSSGGRRRRPSAACGVRRQGWRRRRRSSTTQRLWDRCQPSMRQPRRPCQSKLCDLRHRRQESCQSGPVYLREIGSLMRENVRLLVAQQIEPRRASAGTRSRPRPARSRPSRISSASSFAHSACRCSTSDAA